MTDTELEHRLRGALTARAQQITPERLRFEAPPTMAARPRTRRWWWLTVPVAAAVALAFAGLAGPRGGAPVLPGTPPTVAPSPSGAAPTTAEPAKPQPTSTDSPTSAPASEPPATPTSAPADEPPVTPTSAPPATAPAAPAGAEPSPSQTPAQPGRPREAAPTVEATPTP